MKVTEDNYVELMKQGNEKALQYFIEHYGWIVKSIVCHKLSGHETEQEECMNDVFLQYGKMYLIMTAVGQHLPHG